MASRLPHEDEDEASAAAAAFQSALAQQVRPLLGGWDPVTAMATMHRNLLQQHQNNNSSPLNGQSAAAAMAAAAAAAAASLAPQNGNPTMASLSSLWPYGLPAVSAAPNVPPPVSSAAASLASLGHATSYLNHLQNIPATPESLMSFQQNLLLLEQLQQQRQLLAANPHLLMAAAAQAQSSAHPSASSSPQSNPQLHNNHLSTATTTTTNNNSNNLAQLTLQQQLLQQIQLQQQQQQQHHHQQHQHQHRSSPISNAHLTTTPMHHNATNGRNDSLLTTVNSINHLPNSLTSQHQDSLVDQHFRRSLGEDYNQIIANKAADKINVGK